MASRKFMLSLRDDSREKLDEQAELRGVHLQELLRAVVIPEWLKHQPKKAKP
jgi:hypothetical protein